MKSRHIQVSLPPAPSNRPGDRNLTDRYVVLITNAGR
jgi:hypothetical protein